MKPLHEIRRTPLDRVLPEEHFVMQLNRFMSDLRTLVNDIRIKNCQQWSRAALSYHVGRVHGLWYGMCGQLIWSRGNHVYEECAELAAAARHECDFLTGPYLHQEAA